MLLNLQNQINLVRYSIIFGFLDVVKLAKSNQFSEIFYYFLFLTCFLDQDFCKYLDRAIFIY